MNRDDKIEKVETARVSTKREKKRHELAERYMFWLQKHPHGNTSQMTSNEHPLVHPDVVIVASSRTLWNWKNENEG